MQEFLWNQRVSKETREYWVKRSKDIANCPDNEHILRVKGAGSSRAGIQIMHNGLRIVTNGYYGYMMTMILKENKGVHEPQEERVFQEVLGMIPEDGVMVEVGSNWAFYSLWFASKVNRAICIMVEPTTEGIVSGKINFNINGLSGKFIKAKIGSVSNCNKNIPIETVDNIVKTMVLPKINILHADIQGFEVELLRGCVESFMREKIDFVFISTHSLELHHACNEIMLSSGFKIIASATPSQSYSVDGLLVACRKGLVGIDKIHISQKKMMNNDC